MVKEDDVIKFLLKRGGEATLEDISSALGIPKYGPNSAYAILYSLKSKNVVERRGSRWALVESETLFQEELETEITETKPSDKKIVEDLKRNLEERGETQKKPIKVVIEEMKDKSKAGEAYFLKPDRSYGKLKTLEGLQTGTFLDTIFLGFNGEPLGGIPISGQFVIAGPLGSGKSLLASDVALKAAYSGLKVLYIILDDVWRIKTQMFDLQSRMRLKAEALSLNWDYISEKLYVLNPHKIDGNFVRKYKQLINDEKIDLAVLDSLNSFGRLNKGEEAGRVLDEIVEANRERGVTGFFVMHTNFRYEEPWAWMGDSSYPLYIMDGVILMAPVQLRVLGLNVEVKGVKQLRVVQVLSCRICGFESRGILVNITCNGLVRPIETETSGW